MAPVADEIDAFDLPVEGYIPPELEGRYIRNGSNPLPGTDPGHGFTGQGMLHGVQLHNGKATSYRNRWVKTPLLTGARPYAQDGSRDLTASTANTSVLHYNDAIFALVENCLPFTVTANLETVGPYDFNGKLKTPMTAHPKRDPATGELHFFGYDLRPPFVTYHVASPAGQLLHSQVIDVTGPTMMHDFGITEHYVAWLDLPVVFDMTLAMQRRMPFRWSDEYPARIGIMPRNRHDAPVCWIAVKPAYAFHVANVHEDSDGRIILDAVAYDRRGFNTTWEPLGGVSVLAGEHPLMPISGAKLYQWRIDPPAGLVAEQALDDLDVEFPTVNTARTGLLNRYTYAVTAPLEIDQVSGKIVKYDRGSGERTLNALPGAWIPGEVVFVPARGATAEDDGWLISIVTHETANAAQLLIHSASSFSDPPVAVIHLPRRVPAGFHGAWIPG
jgi:carotenoid cleavage dioxygenase